MAKEPPEQRASASCFTRLFTAPLALIAPLFTRKRRVYVAPPTEEAELVETAAPAEVDDDSDLESLDDGIGATEEKIYPDRRTVASREAVVEEEEKEEELPVTERPIPKKLHFIWMGAPYQKRI